MRILLKILQEVFNNKLRYKTKDYREGFDDCTQLVKIHLLRNGIINQNVLLKRRLLHTERQISFVKRSTSTINNELRKKIAKLERKNNKLVIKNLRLQEKSNNKEVLNII